MFSRMDQFHNNMMKEFDAMTNDIFGSVHSQFGRSLADEPRGMGGGTLMDMQNFGFSSNQNYGGNKGTYMKKVSHFS